MSSPLNLPGFEILQYLGGGPLTCVFWARDLIHGSDCAVKVPRPECQDAVTAVKLLQREARVGLQVQHPNLVRMDEAHVTAPPYFIVMGLLQGEPLRGRLARLESIAWGDAVWITRQVCEALASLHRRGFVHGDVKPDNIHLGDDGSAVLIDLGFAHRPGENVSFLEQGCILGTADYMAPELCGFRDEGDTAGDIFSLGATLFEMLTGNLPYPRGSLRQTLRRHRCDPAAAIQALRTDLPSELVQIVHDMLSHQPRRRPSAGNVVRRLVNLEIESLGWRKAA
jgi:eukaryotic-like serine/threonine-protein kinase